jgi:hypothetical protein
MITLIPLLCGYSRLRGKTMLHPERNSNVVRLPTQTLPFSSHHGIDQCGAKPVLVGPVRDRNPALAEPSLYLRGRHQLLLRVQAMVLGIVLHTFYEVRSNLF